MDNLKVSYWSNENVKIGSCYLHFTKNGSSHLASSQYKLLCFLPAHARGCHHPTIAYIYFIGGIFVIKN
jgi:hypothetical protein